MICMLVLGRGACLGLGGLLAVRPNDDRGHGGAAGVAQVAMRIGGREDAGEGLPDDGRVRCGIRGGARLDAAVLRVGLTRHDADGEVPLCKGRPANEDLQWGTGWPQRGAFADFGADSHAC